ncbi:hypothetical protein ACQUSY_01240 [Microbacterium sp. YY-03]|uniref:hypothetical protein n=1 Tax=Microbacterium sp. YY-03 TaxID=3421636 RepID=UPI003D175C60
MLTSSTLRDRPLMPWQNQRTTTRHSAKEQHSDEELRGLCIRAGGEQLVSVPNDAERDAERPTPW